MKAVVFIACFCGVFYGICQAYHYERLFFRQKLDHFTYTGDDYFLQRFLLNFDYYDIYGNGSLFVYAGNEGDIEMFAENTGFIWEHAQMFGAAILFIEHRYYGLSIPFCEDITFKNKKYLGYLTSEQALADYVEIIMHVKAILPFASDIPVIIFGGSYGGMLAAWMRTKYPHIVAGAIASGAPMLGFGNTVPCDTFPRIVTNNFFGDGGENCIKAIFRSWPIIREMYNQTGGMEDLIEIFSLCGDSFDVEDLIQWLSDTWSYLAMTDYPYPTNFLNPLPANPVKEACNFLQTCELPDDEFLFNIYQAASVFHNYTGNVKCFNFSESGGKKLGERGWDFQSCTEFVHPLCQTGVTDMFERISWNLTAYTEKCLKKYDVMPNMNKTLWMYGGDSLKSASNIVFTNGLRDPWYPSGILKSLSDTVVAIIIPRASHHLDLRSSNPADPPQVIDARQHILHWIWYFIYEARQVKEIR